MNVWTYTAWPWISSYSRTRSSKGYRADAAICATHWPRASTSIVLNLAEGAGKHSKADKRRYDLSSRGSATESAALLDVLLRLGLLDDPGHRAGKERLVRMVSMRIKLAQSLEQ